MAPYELLEPGGFSMDYFHHHTETGVEWIKRFRKRYDKMVWLNPTPVEDWEDGWGCETIGIVRELLPMYPLTLKGLEESLRYLISDRHDIKPVYKVQRDPNEPRVRRRRYSPFSGYLL